MIKLTTPRGLPVNVPESVSEDPSPRFDLRDTDAIQKYYEENGYVIIRSLFSSDVIEQERKLWASEVKPYSGFIYRQATAKAEKHVLNENGWVMNPILNLQSVDPKAFPNFRKFSTENFLASTKLAEAFTTLLHESPKVVQSMYFEGNSATWEHQDSYYLDSEKVGEMTAAWIALEDIQAHAGRFFICPKSHTIKLNDHSLENNIAQHHEKYILSVVEKIKQYKFEIRAPALQKGDVLFWNALTIHGSLNSQDKEHSRSSITCHAIPQSRKFLQLQTRLHDLNVETIHSTQIYRAKDLALLKNRIILFVESRFPKLFYWMKNLVIRLVMLKKQRAIKG